ncbi:MAG TPA: H-NS histone family protein [Xanthomonadaceae bacterium]|nr:H-NS histone family protein [Xanthomonadaceae bacterium]
MTIDLGNLSSKELDTLITKAKKRKVALKKRKPAAAVRRKISALAKAEGYTVAELFGGAGAAGNGGRAGRAPRKASATKGRKLGKVAPKYRNPAKPSETWTGRGKQPRWMAAETAKGRKAEDFLIK